LTWRILELFSGLGAWRLAAADRGSVVAAYDISPVANRVYAATHGEQPIARELATVPVEELAAHGADSWLLSPPCQPYCRMGLRRDLADPRSRAFVHLLDALRIAPVERLALENVEGFVGSDAHALLLDRLDQQGFHQRSFSLCPTRFGIPNQRPRLFLVASRRPLKEIDPPFLPPGPLRSYLDSDEDPRLYLADDILSRHGPGLDIVTADSGRSACFIGGYGRRYVGSGSFLRTERGVRRFSPAEIARLMHLPAAPGFPGDMPLEGRYKLLGNALNVAVARWVLGAF
jgi:DNA (cytosine-5)-methyltransferase 1/tRNA (cytosine38-C5)-methyltransferase